MSLQTWCQRPYSAAAAQDSIFVLGGEGVEADNLRYVGRAWRVGVIKANHDKHIKIRSYTANG